MQQSSREKGKRLEQVVKLIHETLKDRDDTKIFVNHKVKNVSGRPREFDVFIETASQGIVLKIAIECKAFKSPVSVEKIEAFKAKCDRIPDISKKVFVSTSGYQADAINAAREFGISLYNLKTIDKKDVLSWLPVTQLGLRFSVKSFTFLVDADEEVLSDLNSEQFHSFYLCEGQERNDVVNFITEAVMSDKRKFWAFNLLEFMKSGGAGSIGKVKCFPMIIRLGNAFLISSKQERYSIAGIEATIESHFVERPLETSATQIFVSDEAVQAGRVAIDHRDVGTTDIIVTKDNIKIFNTDKEGKTQEFQVLAVYDPKTGTFSKS